MDSDQIRTMIQEFIDADEETRERLTSLQCVALDARQLARREIMRSIQIREEEAREELLNSECFMLGDLIDHPLDTRIFNVLENYRIGTVRELTQKTPEALLKLNNFGHQCLRRVAQLLAYHDLELAGGES